MIINESLKLSLKTSLLTFFFTFSIESEQPTSMKNWSTEIEMVSSQYSQVKNHNLPLIADQSDELDKGYPYTDIPKNIGTDDIEGSELYKSNNLYDPSAEYYETNQGFDETPDYSIPQGE